VPVPPALQNDAADVLPLGKPNFANFSNTFASLADIGLTAPLQV